MQSPWVAIPMPRPGARLRLFCFPYSGGGTATYRSWGAQLPPEIELCAVRLPGREGRFTEPPLRRLERLIGLLVDGLAPFMDRRFSFFGHSMGALVAFELARALRRQDRPTPMHLFVSGRRAPHLPSTRPPGTPPMHALPDAELITELRHLEGTPADVLAVPELLELMLPTLRADFELGETYDHQPSEPLACPITAFGGQGDADVSQDSITAWRAHTQSRFALHMLPGHHFFLHSMDGAILETVTRAIRAGADAQARS